MHDCLIAFGSNEGNSNEVFEQAVKQISEIKNVKLLAASEPLQTQPVGGPEGQDVYLNAAIRIQTILEPQDLHRELVRIETELGRKRRVRWGSRKIDLDLLLYNLVQLETESLTLPHPRMSFRRFVIKPANEIASDMIHVTSGQTIGQLLQALDRRENLVLFVSHGDEFAEHEKMIRQLLPSDWTFEAVSKEAMLDQYKSRAKLVCFVASPSDDSAVTTKDSELDRLVQAAISFPGSTLRLPQDIEKSEMEIKAAFEAIKPLH